MKEEEPADVEYVPESLDDPAALEAFSDVFARFKLPQDDKSVRRFLFRSSKSTLRRQV